MDFQTRYVRYFLAVAEHLSFSKARTACASLSPPCRSASKPSNGSLGLRCQRAGRTVELTNKGKALIEPAKGLVRFASQIDRLIRDMRIGHQGLLLIGASMYSDYPERTALFAAFTAEYPMT